MRTIILSIQGKKYTLPAFSTAKEALVESGLYQNELKRYEDNPIIGALVNGELKPLSAPVPMSCEIEPVRAFQGFGRRIYQ